MLFDRGILSRVRGSQFVRHAGTLLSGNVVAQGIAFLSYLLLSRLFTPKDFGLYNIFYSYIEVLIILSTCKYELAVVVADDDEEAAQMARLTMRMNALVSLALLTLAGMLLLTGTSPMPPALLLLIPPMVFFCGTTRVYTFLCNRLKQYRTIAASEVTTSVGGVAAKIAFGLLNALWTPLHLLGLPVGTILGKVAGNIYLRRKCASLKPPQQPAAPARQLLGKHRNFPLYVAPKELISSFSANLPFLWLSLYFDSAAIGLFSLALTFTMRPVGILSGAFEKVFYADAAAKMRDHADSAESRSAVRRFLLTLNAMALPVVAVAFLFAEPILTFFFGSQWVGTGYYLRCLLPWMWVLLNVNSLTFVANIFSTQRVDLVIQLCQLALRVAALAVGVARQDFHLAILLFCAVSCLTQLGQLGWYLWQVWRNVKC